MGTERISRSAEDAAVERSEQGGYLFLVLLGVGLLAWAHFEWLVQGRPEPRDRWIPTLGTEGRWKRMNLSDALRTRVQGGQTRTIAITVVDFTGKALPNAQVVIELTGDSGAVFRATGPTDDSGVRVFTDVPRMGGRVWVGRDRESVTFGGTELAIDGDATSAQVALV